MTNIVIKLLTMSIELCSVVSNLSPHQKVRGSYFICSSISGVICLPLIFIFTSIFLFLFSFNFKFQNTISTFSRMKKEI